MEVTTKHEKTDFGDVWYMTSEPEGIFRFAIYRYDDDRETIYLSNVFVGTETMMHKAFKWFITHYLEYIKAEPIGNSGAVAYTVKFADAWEAYKKAMEE